MKKKQLPEILFLIIGVLVVFEFAFIRGMFTWLIAVAAVVLVGGYNIIMKWRDKEWLYACLYLLTVVALCMGYLTLL